MKFDYDRNYKPRLGASFKRRPYGWYLIIDFLWLWLCIYNDWWDDWIEKPIEEVTE